MAPALALLAAHRVLVERHSEQVVVVVLSLLLEWLSTCSVIFLAQWTSDIFLMPATLVMIGMAVRRSGDWQDLLRRPIYIILPERHSAFGIANNQLVARQFYIAAACIRVGSILLWILLISAGGLPDTSDMCLVPYFKFVDEGCGRLAWWLQPGCGTSFSLEKYEECLSQASWIQHGVCNLLAAQCRNQDSYGNKIPVSVMFNTTMNLTSLCCPGLWLLLTAWRHLNRRENPWSVPAAPDLHATIEDEEHRLREQFQEFNVAVAEVTWDSWMYRYLHLDFVVYVADMVTDTLCFLLYACEYNWFFAMLQLLILGVSVMKQLKKMAEQGEQGQQAQNVLEAFLTSRRQGFFTEDYLGIVQTQRLVQCPWSFFLQFYSCAFVRSGWYPVLLLSSSIGSSLYGVMHSCYVLFHLDIPTPTMDTKLDLWNPFVFST